MAGKLIRYGALAFLPLALSACVNIGGKGKLPPTLLTLSPAVMAPAVSGASAAPSDALMVLEPETDQYLSVLRIPVQVDGANIAYIKNAQWVERPARLFRALLAESRIKLAEDAPPMAAGVFGYMGYDMVRFMEELPEPNPDTLGLPDSMMIRPTVMAIFDSVPMLLLHWLTERLRAEVLSL